jgi:hypothetical protein
VSWSREFQEHDFTLVRGQRLDHAENLPQLLLGLDRCASIFGDDFRSRDDLRFIEFPSGLVIVAPILLGQQR